MEENNKTTGKHSFYKHFAYKGRPNNQVRDLCMKIKNIEKQHPDLFFNVISEQGACENIRELSFLHKLLIEKISHKPQERKSVSCRFSDDEMSFFINELSKGNLDSKNNFHTFVSQKINYSMEVIKDSEVDFFEENQSLKKEHLGKSIYITINNSNFDWLNSICESKQLQKSYFVRKCLYLYRNGKLNIKPLQPENEKINEVKFEYKEYKLTIPYRLFFKPKKVMVSPNAEMYDLLKEIKEIENKHYGLVKEIAFNFGLCNTYLDLIVFKHYVLKKIECIKHNRLLIHPLCLTQSGIPIIASFVIKSITENKDISALEENLLTNSQTVLKQEDLASTLSLSFFFLIYKTMLDKTNESEKNFPSILKEINESIEINKSMQNNQPIFIEDNQPIKKTKKCLNCGEDFTYKKSNKIVCNQVCYRDFKRTEKDKLILNLQESIINLEEPIIETIFDPFNEPVIVRDYTRNLDEQKIEEPYQEESFEFIFDNVDENEEIEPKIDSDIMIDKIGWLVESINKNNIIRFDRLDKTVENTEHRFDKIEKNHKNQLDLLSENHLDLLEKLNHLEKIISEKENKIVVTKKTSKFNYFMVFLLLFLSSFFLFYLLNKTN
jgi:hypothetical protein